MSDALDRLSALDPRQRAELERKLHARRAARTAVTDRGGEDDAVPLSPGQRRMWFLDQLGPDFPAYTIVAGWRVDGTLDRTALHTAFRAVVDRHPMLRTVFAEVDGEPRQHVRPSAGDLPLMYEDLSGLASEEWHSATQRVARQETQHRFDLTRGPLIRLRLLRMAAEEHRLIISAHHIALDGWSLSLVLSDLLRAYGEAVAGRAIAWDPLPATYADFLKRAAHDDAHLAYWRRVLDGMPQSLELPTDRPRSSRLGFRGRRVTFWLDEDLTSALRELAASRRGTLFTVLLAGWQALLSRYTGSRDIPVGTPISIRPGSDFDGVVGLFLNTLVMRGDLSGDPSFATLVRRTTERAFEGFEHRDFPFERLVDQLAESRDLAHNPLFQVMMVLQNTPPALDAAGGLRLTPLDMIPETAKFDLNLQVTEVGGRLRCDLDYAADLFDAERTNRLAGHYRQLLTHAVDDPDLPVSELPLLTLEEQALLSAWDRTDDRAAYRSLPRQFRDAVREHPERPAICFDSAWLTYGELAERVNRLAGRLKQAGVGTDTVVGVCLPRGVDLVVALHAVHAAGGAYLPLEPHYPAGRLAFMASDAQAVAVVTLTEHAATFGETGARVLRLDDEEEAVAEQDSTRSDPPPDALAYVIYTSGSTGVPKGVGVSHRAISNRLGWMQRFFPIGPGDRVLQKTPASFDVSVWEFFWPFTAGAALVVAAPDGHRDSGYLVELMERERITTVHFVPSMLDAFCEEPYVGDRLKDLRRVFSSGEALSTDLAARCLDALPHVELHNLYGPTEAAVDVTWQPVRGLSPRTAVPIGDPVPGTRIEILDAAGARVPLGVPGELCIAGLQLARGYVGRPSLTAERFVPDPYGPPGSRLYRTGDLARRRSSGAIDFLGRLDHQVKVHGFRIELGEIEAALADQPEVRAAVVLVQDTRLVAYLVTDHAVDWAARLRDRLPAHMIPADYRQLDRLPVTSNGKLDRAALLRTATPVPAVPGEPPAEGTERLIAEIWRDALGLAAVGADDDFFAVGGDSIRSLKVVSRLRKAGLEVTLADLFRHRTPRELSRHLNPAHPDHSTPPTVAFGLLNPADAARIASQNGEDQ
ncbi:non-ribosomal peptide synthetase [Nonomuraea aurantiaca]|uniref:non-ribosomal peptide synthetase n=1 Tax=Nonomuraea aurantiaca TaxID=2878562 RepID=UPI001CD9F416|nr:non-ribosomal peptide synthetase [Nonomuraea aurantiaca]MCA2230006.1 amino acid adenylation domain-containing protein [Nonomuraea aurantiaca]